MDQEHTCADHVHEHQRAVVTACSVASVREGDQILASQACMSVLSLMYQVMRIRGRRANLSRIQRVTVGILPNSLVGLSVALNIQLYK